MIPTNEAKWPPAAMALPHNGMREWATWWAGDTTQLTRFYSGAAQVRPSQLRGGVTGALARFWWGRPDPGASSSARVHVPLAADICSTSAALLFGEELTITGGTEQQHERLDYVLERVGYLTTLQGAAQSAAALGGVYLTAEWDTDEADHPLVRVIDADHATPTFSPWGRLREVTFCHNLEPKDGDERNIWRHFERYAPGLIEHGLFRGTLDNVGKRVPLEEHPAVESIPVDSASEIKTGLDQISAVYVPNITPNPTWRDHPTAKHLGRSDLSGVVSLLDQLDETWSDLMRERRLSKARVFVSDAALDTAGPGSPATFDVDREAFIGVPVLGSVADSKMPVELIQPAMRVEAYLQLVGAMTQDIVRMAGYSPATFGLEDVAGEQTATEVRAKERKSLSTRETKTRNWGTGLADLLELVTAIDHDVFGQGPAWRPALEWPADVQPSLGELSLTVQGFRAARSHSTRSIVQIAQPDLSPEEVDAEVAQILGEDTTTEAVDWAEPV